jgi:hypothetical protein
VKRLNIFLIVVFFAACSNRTGIPNDILPPDSMSRIMKDVIMADEYSTVYISKDSLQKDKLLANQHMLEGIFKIHHVSREEFQNSLRFYESRPDLNKEIFDSLSAFANKHKTELYLPKPFVKPILGPAK